MTPSSLTHVCFQQRKEEVLLKLRPGRARSRPGSSQGRAGLWGLPGGFPRLGKGPAPDQAACCHSRGFWVKWATHGNSMSTFLPPWGRQEGENPLTVRETLCHVSVQPGLATPLTCFQFEAPYAEAAGHGGGAARRGRPPPPPPVCVGPGLKSSSHRPAARTPDHSRSRGEAG